MDDGQFIEFAGTRGPWGFVTWWDHLANGSLRYVSLALLWPIYRVGYEFGPTSLFIVNAAVVILCLLAFLKAFEPSLPRKSGAAGITFLAVAMIWPFSADLVFFPSLQEKFVILGAAGLLAWTRSVPIGPVPSRSWIVFVVAVVLAFPTKLHIVVFVPALIFVMWSAADGKHARFTRGGWQIASALLSLASIVVVAVALRGDYTSSNRGSLFDFSRLIEWRFLILLLTSIGVLALVFLGRPWRRWRARSDVEADLLPLVMLASMAGTYLIWDVKQRYLTVVAVMVGAAAAAWVSRLGPRLSATIAVVTLALAGVWLTVRLPQVFGSHGSFGEFIGSDTARSLSAEGATVYSTCIEAPDRYAYYAELEGVDGIQFGWLEESRLRDEASGVRLVLADGVLCPLANTPSDGVVVRWEAESGRGFRLLEVTS